MNIIITESYDQSCEKAAAIIRDVIKNKPDAKLGLATGGTPVPIYARLIEMNKSGELDFAKVRTVNLDEYAGIDPEHPQSYRYFMNDNLFNHINIDKNNTFVATGSGNPEDGAKLLEEKVFEGGAPDIQLLGIGNNGHVGFNEAGDYLTAEAHVEVLTESTIQANARFFDSPSDVPTKAITMGMNDILAAKKIILVATGDSKKDAISGLVKDGKITTQNPSTFLKMHEDTTIIIDRALASLAGL